MCWQGMSLGSVVGPWGALGGVFLGCTYGLFTKNAHVAQIDAKIQAEGEKDRQLEAQIQKEIDRQRELEAMPVKTDGVLVAKKIDQPRSAEQVSQVRKGSPDGNANIQPAVASLDKKTASPAAAPSPPKNVEVKDINGDGVPDLWIYYNPLKPTEILRQEESTKGNGKIDSWSYFKDGKLFRRELDTKGTGKADVVYFYDGDKLSREERDEYGDGRPNFRGYYQDGRLVKVEKDLGRKGKPDLWIYYDPKKDNVILKEERDLDGDGKVDLWSYYENGRLARREVTATGLEILSKQGDLPSSSPTDSKRIASPAK
jgi:antitoxin component YwqK of YwqJK toxin-antitoxin module